jgi:hypothetical protein
VDLPRQPRVPLQQVHLLPGKPLDVVGPGLGVGLLARRMPGLREPKGPVQALELGAVVLGQRYIRVRRARTFATNGRVTLYGPCLRTARSP